MKTRRKPDRFAFLDEIVDDCIRESKSENPDCRAAVKASLAASAVDVVPGKGADIAASVGNIYANFKFWKCLGGTLTSYILAHLLVLIVTFGIIFACLVTLVSDELISIGIKAAVAAACGLMAAVIYHILWVISAKYRVMNSACATLDALV